MEAELAVRATNLRLALNFTLLTLLHTQTTRHSPTSLITSSPNHKNNKKGASIPIVVVVVITICLTLESKLFPHMVPLYKNSSDAATAPRLLHPPPLAVSTLILALALASASSVLATPKPLRVLGSSMRKSSFMSKPKPIPTCRSLPVQHDLTT